MKIERIAQVMTVTFNYANPKLKAIFEADGNNITLRFKDDPENKKDVWMKDNEFNENEGIPMLLTIASWFLENYDIYFRNESHRGDWYYQCAIHGTFDKESTTTNKKFKSINETLLRAMEDTCIRRYLLNPEVDNNIITKTIIIPMSPTVGNP